MTLESSVAITQPAPAPTTRPNGVPGTVYVASLNSLGVPSVTCVTTTGTLVGGNSLVSVVADDPLSLLPLLDEFPPRVASTTAATTINSSTAAPPRSSGSRLRFPAGAGAGGGIDPGGDGAGAEAGSATAAAATLVTAATGTSAAAVSA